MQLWWTACKSSKGDFSNSYWLHQVFAAACRILCHMGPSPGSAWTLVVVHGLSSSSLWTRVPYGIWDLSSLTNV